jgi:ArsR family transcriptional regulator, arsenate/arsenite/antimonite-responsive transcriptional repressor
MNNRLCLLNRHMTVTHIDYSGFMDESDLAECLSALGHLTRLRVVRMLISAPEGMPAGKIAERLAMRQNSLSPHLGVLVRSRFVLGTRDGREVIYSAQTRNIEILMRDIGKALTAA